MDIQRGTQLSLQVAIVGCAELNAVTSGSSKPRQGSSGHKMFAIYTIAEALEPQGEVMAQVSL